MNNCPPDFWVAMVALFVLALAIVSGGISIVAHHTLLVAVIIVCVIGAVVAIVYR